MNVHTHPDARPSLTALRLRMYIEGEDTPRIIVIQAQGKPMDPDVERAFWRAVETGANVASMAR